MCLRCPIFLKSRRKNPPILLFCFEIPPVLIFFSWLERRGYGSDLAVKILAVVFSEVPNVWRS